MHLLAHRGKKTHLHHLQLLEPLLQQVLHLPGVLDILIFPEGVPRPPLRVLPEVVGLEALARPQKLPVLCSTANPSLLAFVLFFFRRVIAPKGGIGKKKPVYAFRVYARTPPRMHACLPVHPSPGARRDQSCALGAAVDCPRAVGVEVAGRSRRIDTRTDDGRT